MNEKTGQSDAPRSLTEAIAAVREGDFSHTRLARFSDLSRDEARVVSASWLEIPEDLRADFVRRLDELSEYRLDVNFRRVLRIALSDPSPVVRQLAVAGLWEDDSRDMLDRLTHLMQTDPSSDVRAEAARALERFAGQAARGELDSAAAIQLRDLLMESATRHDTPYGVQRRSLEALGSLGEDAEVAAAIEDAYGSDDQGLRCSALYAMGRSQLARWLPLITQELESDEAEVRFEAARAAGGLGAVDALPLLIDAAGDDDAEVRHAAIAAIGQIGGRGAVRALERLSEDAGEADMELIESTIEDVNTMLDPSESS